MSDENNKSDAPADTPVAAEKKAPKKPRFTFTDDGCRWEIRLGMLLLLAGIFLWQWLGPARAIWLCIAGIPLVAMGMPLQVRDARTLGRPGYPWKLALTLTALGVIMYFDLGYRQTIDGPLIVMPTVWLLLLSGLYLLLGWPLARPAAKKAIDGA